MPVIEAKKIEMYCLHLDCINCLSFYLNYIGKFLSVKVTIYILVYWVSIVDSTKRHHKVYKG